MRETGWWHSGSRATVLVILVRQPGEVMRSAVKSTACLQLSEKQPGMEMCKYIDCFGPSTVKTIHIIIHSFIHSFHSPCSRHQVYSREENRQKSPPSWSRHSSGKRRTTNTHVKKKRTRMIEVKMEVGGGGTNVNSVVGDGILENAQT